MSKYIALFGALILVVFAILLFIPHRKITENKIQLKKISMKISSSAFENNQEIPTKYTCDGKNTNPPLSFSNIPQDAKSLALIMDDPDAPMGTFVHWVLYNMPVDTREIKEGSLSNNTVSGKNSAGSSLYIGPCPPSGTHKYFFKLYALDSMLDVGSNADKKVIEDAIQKHLLEKAQLVGLYSKKN